MWSQVTAKEGQVKWRRRCQSLQNGGGQGRSTQVPGFDVHTTGGQPGSSGHRSAVARNARKLEAVWQAFPDSRLLVAAIKLSIRGWDELKDLLQQV